MHAARWVAVLAILVGATAGATGRGQEIGPATGTAGSSKRPATYAEMEELLQRVDELDHIAVGREGRTKQGRIVYSVHLNRGGERATWKVLFFAQQHGDEHAGKDALLTLIDELARNPSRLPEEVDLWILPMVNPDGATVNERSNASGADLNRDYMGLEQAETQALFRVFLRVMPHVSVDCHEFSRAPVNYAARGWSKWPLIMMDTANHPLFDESLVAAGVRWCERVAPALEAAGHNYTRYTLGDVPPENEWRYSALEADDARNGLGAYGGLSFIVESGVYWRDRDPQADLDRRVDAYLVLLRRFLDDTSSRAADRRIIERARRAPLPEFLPTNSFWGNAGTRATPIRVIERATGLTRTLTTPNFMQDRVIKRSVATPGAYAIDAAHAERFRAMLERHGVSFEVLEAPRKLLVERCRLLRVEEDPDVIYERFGGRQVVERGQVAEVIIPRGALLVPLDGRQTARTVAAILLEPCMLYGLYQYPEYRAMAGPDGVLPVGRVVGPVAGPEPPAARSGFVLVVHGGIGVLPEEEMSRERRAEYVRDLEVALRKGHAILEQGGSGLNAVEVAIRHLEDSPLYNAGRGAALTSEGTVELDAAIMDGKTKEAGAVAGLTRVRNPIAAARAVMDHSGHVLLVGPGAERFAEERGLEMRDLSYFRTERRVEELRRARRPAGVGPPGPAASSRIGTVGAVALDRRGNLAAGTSTGGLTNKRPGRVGDSPLIGCGTYADNATCAVSATGHGELFIRYAVAHDIAARIRYGKQPVEAAAEDVVNKTLKKAGAEGGVIVLDAQGRFATPFNCEGMYRGYIGEDGRPRVALYDEDETVP